MMNQMAGRRIGGTTKNSEAATRALPSRAATQNGQRRVVATNIIELLREKQREEFALDESSHRINI